MPPSHAPDPGSTPGEPHREPSMAEQAATIAARLTHPFPGVPEIIEEVESLRIQVLAAERDVREPDFRAAVEYKAKAAQHLINLEMLVAQEERIAGRSYHRIDEEYDHPEDRAADLNLLGKCVLSRDRNGLVPPEIAMEALSSAPDNSKFREVFAEAARPHIIALGEPGAAKLAAALSEDVVCHLFRHCMQQPVIDLQTLEACRGLLEVLERGHLVDGHSMAMTVRQAAPRLEGNPHSIVILNEFAKRFGVEDQTVCAALAPELSRAFDNGIGARRLVQCLELCNNVELVAALSKELTRIVLLSKDFASAERALKLLDGLMAKGQNTGYALRDTAQKSTVEILGKALDRFERSKTGYVEPVVRKALEVISRIGDGKTLSKEPPPFSKLTAKLIGVIENGDPATSLLASNAFIASARVMDPAVTLNYISSKLNPERDLEQQKFGLSVAKSLKRDAVPLANSIALLGGVELVGTTYQLKDVTPQPGETLNAQDPEVKRQVIETLGAIDSTHRALELLSRSG